MTEHGEAANNLATATLTPLPGYPGVKFHSLPALAAMGFAGLQRLPVSLRIVLESVLRHSSGDIVEESSVRELACWKPNGERVNEVPFTVGRIVLNCAAGIPLLGDLTAMRSAMAKTGLPAESVQPAVPVDMALDHTMSVDFYGTPTAMARNMELDVARNKERYRFVKWAMQAYRGVSLFPPGSGILHQLNLEHMAPGLLGKDGVVYSDTLVGTDSHTCMIAGLGTVGWGVGGIEAQTAVLGLPIFFLTPDVVGIHVTGRLREGVTSTDLVLHVTRMLRQEKVVGKFVEFFGPAVSTLTVPDRATIANMAPEYGATIGYFPVDEQTCLYLRQTGREPETVKRFEAYFRAQGLFGAPQKGEIDYSRTLELPLDEVVPAVAGPMRPQDLVALPAVKSRFNELLGTPRKDGGFGKQVPQPAKAGDIGLADGSVVIAAITSCTNTSNPGVIMGAGLLARNAVAYGLKTPSWVKTSLTPGSMVVSRYLEEAGLQDDLNQLGFAVAGYTCATCVGASGPLDPAIEKTVQDNDLVACAVLSGNRNFEARIHPSVRASFLASPPLVVAYALAGRVNIDFETEPLGHDQAGNPVFLRDVWPDPDDVREALALAANPAFYKEVYGGDTGDVNPGWKDIAAPRGALYPWDENSTYLKEPPFLAPEWSKSVFENIHGARALAVLGDSVSTDHISPIGAIGSRSPAGIYLSEKGVESRDFNNFGSRRMNDEIMIRGTFSNVRLRNQLSGEIEGGFTKLKSDGEIVSIYDAAMHYRAEGVPLVVFAGEEYGTGSARDWAAKGTRLLGVRAVIAKSFERIHRSNLVGMGVLPCQLPEDVALSDLALTGDEQFDILGLEGTIAPRQSVELIITRADGTTQSVPLTLRMDTVAEQKYLVKGGIMPFLLDRMANA